MRGYSAIAAGGVMLLSVGLDRAYGYGESVDGFPNWEERVLHEWANRARVDPQTDLANCPNGNCGEAACYTPGTAPVLWNLKLNRAARFHSDEMSVQNQNYFGHDSTCNIVDNIDSLYPATCQGAAACACENGTATTWSARVALFGQGTNGEIIASGGDPNGAFYQWLHENYDGTTCAYVQGTSGNTNGHRWHLLKTGPSVGFGKGGRGSVGDFGAGGQTYKIPSGSHYPRQSGSVEAWANWHDTAGPMSALINVDGTCQAMSLQRGVVTAGAYRATLTNVASGCHRYFFLFKDSTGTLVTYPSTGSLGIGPAGSCADWDATRPATGAGCDCAPQCSGKTCGDDGCGGSCGNCGGNETCEVDTCVPAFADDAGPGSGGSNNDGDAGVDPGGTNDGGGGCCDTGTSSRSPLVLLAWLAVLGLVIRPRRRHSSASPK